MQIAFLRKLKVLRFVTLPRGFGIRNRPKCIKLFDKSNVLRNETEIAV
jgi:hypothetical protein